MSHEIESIAFANQVPWHGLGNRVDSCVTVDEMLVAAGLDWEVKMCPMKTEVEPGVFVPAKSKFALVRNTDHRVMTVASENWKPLQNRDCLGFMRNYVEAGGATLETAGSLRNGNIVWGLARLNHTFAVRPNDKVTGYLLITSPHQVGNSISIRTTPIRVVCANTMAMAERASTVNYRQNHLTEFDVTAAKDHVGRAHEELAAAEARYKVLAGIKISMREAMEKVLLNKVFNLDLVGYDFDSFMDSDKKPKAVEQLIASLTNGPGAETETAWGALNGVTHWADHVAGNTANARMMRAWTADTGKIKRDVEDALLELA